MSSQRSAIKKVNNFGPIFLKNYLEHNNWLHSWMWSKKQTRLGNHCRGQSHLPIWNNSFKEKNIHFNFQFYSHKIKILNAFCSRCSTLIVATDTKQLSYNHMFVEYTIWKMWKKTGFSIALTFSSRGDIVYTCFKFQNFAKNCWKNNPQFFSKKDKTSTININIFQ